MKATINDELTVEFVELGEGWSGDYDPDNPDDEELIRFDVTVTNEAAERYNVSGEPSSIEGQFEPRDCSYCTAIPVQTPVDFQARLAAEMAATLYAAMVNGESLKRTSEELSHTRGPRRHP